MPNNLSHFGKLTGAEDFERLFYETTIALGKDSVYINAVQRYSSYNRTCLEQYSHLDYYLLTDREEKIKGLIHVPCPISIWSYTIILKNNYIADYLNAHNKWDGYTHLYDFGRLLKSEEKRYRFLWDKYPEKREVLDITTNKIHRQMVMPNTADLSPVISIIMPVYNVSLLFLMEAVESILNQTYKDFELIIINDGSTEQEGLNWLRACTDPRIRLIDNSHDFIKTLNMGIEVAKGKYIVRMDADDIMLPNRLQQQYEFMEKHMEVDVCGSWMELFGTNNRTITNPITHEQIIASMLSFNPLFHPSVIIRKISLVNKDTSSYKEGYPYAEDYKLWTDMAIKGYRFANIPEVLLKYRISDKQVTHLLKTEMLTSSKKIQHEYLEWVMEYVTEKKNEMEPVFNTLIDAVNNEILSIRNLTDITYSVFFEMLQLEK
jgi:glycosyltransferase involved in cell wall biosynthesis